MTPLSALLILAARQNIPDELYEAANLDGCSPWQSFRRITLPLVRPGIAIAMVQAVIATLNVFDQPYVLNGAAPTGASVTMQTYFISFQNLDFGEGYALSLLITVATLIGRSPSSGWSTGRWTSDAAADPGAAAPGSRSSCSGRCCRSTGR